MVYHTEEELYKKKEMKIKPILSVLPYLTEIVGQLYEAKNYDYLKYILLPADATELYFVKQGDKIIASNLSKKYFQIILPAEKEKNGYTYLIPPKKNVDGTQEIISHACAYSEKIEISCIDVPVNFTNEDNGNIYLFAKGDISREIEGSVHIGNGISIEWTDGHLIVSTCYPLRLRGILFLNIIGNGYAPERKYLDVFPEDTTGKGFQSISLHDSSASYQGSECIKLEINVVCVYDTSSLEISKSFSNEMEEADNSFLKYGKCLNVK